MSRAIHTGLLVVCVLLGTCASLHAQLPDDYYRSGYMRFEDFIYNPSIKTVIFENAADRLSEPIMDLNANQKLRLAFDDLEGDYKNYFYTLVHCNADWTPSSILQNEYLEGFTEDLITDYKLSFNTLQHYTHYELIIPGREVRPIVTGNYLVVVYPEGHPETPVLTRRMLIVQNQVSINANEHRATLVPYIDTRQEIDFSIRYPGIQVANPFDDIKVVLRQNGRWDNAITGLKPLFLKSDELEYSYDDENTFNGGNEFRTFDIRTLRLQTQWIADIRQTDSTYIVELLPSKSRSFGRYVIENDINGKFLIRNQDGRDDDLEGEYAKVRFTLLHDILAGGNFYVFGALTDWRVGAENKMTYNYDESQYELELYLKQGYYDYEFVFLEDGHLVPDETIVEGNHYETNNTYDILVYFRPLGGRYDRLVGYSRILAR